MGGTPGRRLTSGEFDSDLDDFVSSVFWTLAQYVKRTPAAQRFVMSIGYGIGARLS
jgi:hypothetical protein